MTHDPRFDVPHDFRRQPARVAVALGLVVTIIASLLPWIDGTNGAGHRVSLNGFVGPGDGGFLTVFGVAQGVVVLSRWTAEARAAVLRVMPALIGVVLILTCFTAQLDVGSEIRGIEFEGGHVAITAFFWAAVGGALLMAVAGFWLTTADRLRRGPWLRRAEIRAAVDRRVIVPALLGVVGALGGFVIVLSAGARTFESALVLILVVVALIGAIVGGWLGYRIGGWLVATPPSRDRR